MYNKYPSSYIPILRMYNSHILNPAHSFESVASSLFGVQSQIFNASAIAFAVRTEQKTFSQFKHTLNTLRLIRLWGIRTTIHIYHPNDWCSLLSHLSVANNWYKTKMEADGIDIDGIGDKVLNIIKNVDYFDRNFLKNKGIDKKYLGAWGDLLIELNNRGYIFHYINPTNRNKLFGNVQVVFGKKIESAEQLSDVKKKLALKYFRAYAPATLYDFKHWLGITVRESDDYFCSIKEKLISVRCGCKEYYIELGSQNTLDRIFQIYADDSNYYLLPKFDPLLLAYHDKSWIIEENLRNKIWKVAGQVEGIILQHGKAIATWRYKLKNKVIDFEISPFCRRFSVKNMEKAAHKIACFFERSIGTITLT